MKRFLQFHFIAALMVMLLINTVSAQEDPKEKGIRKKISIDKLVPLLSPVSDYSGEFSERTTISGDWGGVRQKKLYNGGFTLDVALTQTIQGGAAGGNPTTGDYYGLLDYAITLDTGRLGWWSGGFFVFDGQTNFGSTDLLSDAGSLSPVNMLMIYPFAPTSNSFLMEYYLLQGLSEKMILMFGRLNATNILDKNIFANQPRTQFLNAALNNDILILSVINLSTYGVVLFNQISKSFGLALAYFDANAKPGEFGVPGGIFQKWGIALDVGVSWNHKEGLYGGLDVVGIYTNKDPADLENPTFVKDAIKDALGEAPLPTANGNWLINVTFNQYLWKPGKDSPQSKYKVPHTFSYEFNQRGLGLFARVGYLPADRNIFSQFYSLGFGGCGIFKNRPYDRIGLGWYMVKKSKDADKLPVNLIDNENGFEFFYTFAFTPSIQLAGDFQYIRPFNNSIENSYVGGARLLLQF